jgi:hypothetical protein
LAEFAKGINEDCGCDLNVAKCKMYSPEKGACVAARMAGYATKELQHLQEGVHVSGAGHLLRGLRIFNVPVGEERYIVVRLREKATQVEDTKESYVRDQGDEYPHELWTMLQF